MSWFQFKKNYLARSVLKAPRCLSSTSSEQGGGQLTIVDFSEASTAPKGATARFSRKDTSFAAGASNDAKCKARVASALP